VEGDVKGEAMATDIVVRKMPARSAGHAGMFWFAGWLFTLGFTKLVWWKALIALIVWPYFLAQAVH
jgi:hypothetical protein